MRDFLVRGWMNLFDRVGGPMTFRLILQPAMATLLAVLAGLRDAREGRPPYLWTVLTDPLQRADLLREGWKEVGRVFLLALIMDTIYQLIVERWIYPLELLTVAIVLAVVPYLLVRGPVNRIARLWLRKEKTQSLTASNQQDAAERRR
jgi:hypothetical protein